MAEPSSPEAASEPLQSEPKLASEPDTEPEPDATSAPPGPRGWRLVWPLLACLLFLLWSNIPPYRMHINEVRWGDHAFAWHWRLYEHGGRGVCDVRYYDMHKGGELIERWKLLGYARPGEMPDKIARTHKKQLRPDYNRVCKAVKKAGDPDPYLEVATRCGGKLGWDVIEKRHRNVCIIPGKRRKTKKTKKSKAKAKAKAKKSRESGT